MQALGRVLTQNPNSVQGRLALAQAYAAADNTDAARSRRSSEIVEDEPRVASALAQYQELAGQFEGSGGELHARDRRHADEPRAEVPPCRSALPRPANSRAPRTFAAEAQAEHPEDLRFPRLQARALFDGGAPARAYRGARAGGARRFPRTRRHSSRWRTCTTRRIAIRTRSARSGSCCRSSPGNPDALNYLGYMLAERGEQLDEAIRLVRRALDVTRATRRISTAWAGRTSAAGKWTRPRSTWRRPRRSCRATPSCRITSATFRRVAAGGRRPSPPGPGARRRWERH